MASECGCVSRDWYGCLRCGKEECDEETHSSKYEHQAIIDSSGCRFAALRAELQAAHEEIERLKQNMFMSEWARERIKILEQQLQAVRDGLSEMGQQFANEGIQHEYTKQQLATAQVEIERLKASSEQRSPAET